MITLPELYLASRCYIQLTPTVSWVGHIYVLIPWILAWRIEPSQVTRTWWGIIYRSLMDLSHCPEAEHLTSLPFLPARPSSCSLSQRVRTFPKHLQRRTGYIWSQGRHSKYWLKISNSGPEYVLWSREQTPGSLVWSRTLNSGRVWGCAMAFHSTYITQCGKTLAWVMQTAGDENTAFGQLLKGFPIPHDIQSSKPLLPCI